jgi:hypothetical protein
MRVIYLKKVRVYFKDLIPKLHELGYFSYVETAEKYVAEIFDEIEKQLPIQRRRPAPERFDKYGKGMMYIVIRKNRRTHWYVFFKTAQKNGETIYRVRYIANNHVIAQYL